jgi:GDP-4-dehydro-6-deoxy-D-mannose reductase
MRFLITGITGFVGPHLANLLVQEGHEVFGLVRSSNGREDDIRDVVPDNIMSRLQFVYGDLTDRSSLERILGEHPFDGIFHLAAQSHPPTGFLDPYGTFAVNAVGTVNLEYAIRKTQRECRLMFCSTSEVYGAVPEEQGPIDESFPLAPINPYAVSKAAADLWVRERATSLNLPYFVTRAFSHTGPRRGRRFSISSDAYQIARILKGHQEPIIRVGNLRSKRTIMDVRDCCRAYYLLMLRFSPGEAYNVGGDESYTMEEILHMLLDIAGLQGAVKITVDPQLVRPIDIPVQICNSAKCRALTGWRPEIPVRQTLRDLLNYWLAKIS